MSELTCAVVDGDGAYSGAQGFDYFEGISAESSGARGLCMHRLEIPPGGAARPHLHEHHETAIYVLAGRAEMRYGDGLREHLEVHAGQFLFIPAGMPHLPYNPSQEEPCVAVLARTDPNEQESVVLLDAEGGARDRVIHEHPAATAGARGTLVLLHGITDSGRCWPDAVSRWTAAGWRVLACDARGHGDAPRWGDERTPGDVMVGDVLDLLERERGGRVVVIGHSMGAAVGVAAASQRPSRVAAVVAEDPPWALPAGELAAARLAELRDVYRQVIALGRSALIARKRDEAPGWPAAELEPWAIAKEQFDVRLLADRGVLPSEPWPELVAALRDLGIPLLLVTGDRDVEVDDDVAREAARLGARVVRVPSAGHCVRRDRPAAYHAAVDRFVTAAVPA